MTDWRFYALEKADRMEGWGDSERAEFLRKLASKGEFIPGWLGLRREFWISRLRSPTMFAARCAERVLPIFESVFPDDDLPRKRVEEVLSGEKVKPIYARGSWGEFSERPRGDFRAAQCAAQSALWASRSALSLRETRRVRTARLASKMAEGASMWLMGSSSQEMNAQCRIYVEMI